MELSGSVTFYKDINSAKSCIPYGCIKIPALVAEKCLREVHISFQSTLVRHHSGVTACMCQAKLLAKSKSYGAEAIQLSI